MAKLARCDNKRCEKDIPEGATYHELSTETEAWTLSMDPRPKQFCSLGCVAEFAADACGMVVNRA